MDSDNFHDSDNSNSVEEPYSGFDVEAINLVRKREPGVTRFTVKDFDPADQPREKALKHGCSTLSTPDLFAIILRTGIVGKPITELCRDLMRNAGGKLHILERKQREELLQIKGIGTTKVLQIEAIMELIKRYNLEGVDERTQISNSKGIYQAIAPFIANLPHEEIWIIFLNRQNRIICRKRFSKGSAVASVFDCKAIIRDALINQADSIAMAHNHPSGALRPSPQDDMITRQLKEAAKIFDISFIDHVICTTTGYYSYHDEGRL